MSSTISLLCLRILVLFSLCSVAASQDWTCSGSWDTGGSDPGTMEWKLVDAGGSSSGTGTVTDVDGTPANVAVVWERIGTTIVVRLAGGSPTNWLFTMDNAGATGGGSSLLNDGAPPSSGGWISI